MRTGRASVFGPWSCSTLSSDPTTPTVQLKSFAHMHQVTDTYPSGKRCLNCPPGTISHNPGSTTCTECGVGTYVSAAACTQNQTTNAKQCVARARLRNTCPFKCTHRRRFLAAAASVWRAHTANTRIRRYLFFLLPASHRSCL